MLCLLLIFACGPGDYDGPRGIQIQNVGGDIHVTISPETLTATLNDRLNLSATQLRAISRIVMNAGAEIEDAHCASHKHDSKHIKILLRHMDRGIEKQLSPRQRARYQALKEERKKAMVVQQAKAD